MVGTRSGRDETSCRDTSPRHRSVSFSSMRGCAEGVFGFLGIERLEFGEAGRHLSLRRTPSEIRYCTTEMARADDSSQFDLNCGC